MCGCICIYVYANMCVLMYVCVCACVCACMCIRIYIYIYMCIVCPSVCMCGLGSSVAIATDYGLDCPVSNPDGDEIFRPCSPALRPTQHLGTGVFPGVKVDTSCKDECAAVGAAGLFLQRR